MQNNKRRIQIKDLLKVKNGKVILHTLQAGRVRDNNVDRPYRLSDEELELLKDEYIYFWDDGDRYYASFEKSVNEIRALLNLPPQHNTWFF